MKLTFIYINFSLSSNLLTFYFEKCISNMINIYNDCKLFLGKTNTMGFHFSYTCKHKVTHLYDRRCKGVCVYAHTQIYFRYCEGFMQLCILMVDFPKAQTSFSEWNVYMVIYEKITYPQVIWRVGWGKGMFTFILGAGQCSLLQFPSPPSLSPMHLATFFL